MSKNSELFQKVTESLVSKMNETGLMPWEFPFAQKQSGVMQRNFVSNKRYKGVNFWSLYARQENQGFIVPSWVTFKQASDLGLKIKKGAKGSDIVFFKMLEKESKRTDSQGLPMVDKIPLVSRSFVFNVGQCEGFTDQGKALIESLVEIGQSNAVSLQDDLMGKIMKIGASVSFDLVNKAYYSPAQDRIVIPDFSLFNSRDSFYATIFHELSHWTKGTDTDKRTGRKPKEIEGIDSKDSAYAWEELVAEFSAAYLCAYFGFNYETQHASYLQGWHKAINNDKDLLQKAIAEATKASDYILTAMGEE